MGPLPQNNQPEATLTSHRYDLHLTMLYPANGKKNDTLYRNSNFENRQSKRRDTTRCCFMLRFKGSDVVGFYIFIQFHSTDGQDEERSVLSLHFSHWHQSVSFTEGSPYYNAVLPNWQIWLTSITKFVWHTSNKAIGAHTENCSILRYKSTQFCRSNQGSATICYLHSDSFTVFVLFTGRLSETWIRFLTEFQELCMSKDI